MTDKSNMAGVYVTESRIKDFLGGIYGKNQEANRKALKGAVEATAIAAVYAVVRERRRGRRM